MKLLTCAIAAALLIALSQAAIGACLSIEYDGMEDYWVNQCSVEVGVNWTDAGPCKDWACSASVPAKGRRPPNNFFVPANCRYCQGPSCNVQVPSSLVAFH